MTWSGPKATIGTVTYGDVFHQNEVEQSTYNFEHANVRHAVPPLRRTTKARPSA